MVGVGWVGFVGVGFAVGVAVAVRVGVGATSGDGTDAGELAIGALAAALSAGLTGAELAGVDPTPPELAEPRPDALVAAAGEPTADVEPADEA